MHSGFDQFLVLVLPSFMINEHVTLLKYDSYNMTNVFIDLLWCKGWRAQDNAWFWNFSNIGTFGCMIGEFGWQTLNIIFSVGNFYLKIAIRCELTILNRSYSSCSGGTWLLISSNTRINTKWVIIMNHKLLNYSPFGGGASKIFSKWNVEWKVRGFFWTIWEVENWSIGFGYLPLKKRRWEGCCAICFTDTDILSGCWNSRFKVDRNQLKNSPVRSNPHVGWVIWAETSSLGVGSSWIS